MFKNIKNFKALTAEPETKCDAPPQIQGSSQLGHPPSTGPSDHRGPPESGTRCHCPGGLPMRPALGVHKGEPLK